MTNRFTRQNFLRCKTLAADMAGSISGVIRLLIKEAYEKRVIVLKQDDSQS
jgi:hypothetical protein